LDCPSFEVERDKYYEDIQETSVIEKIPNASIENLNADEKTAFNILKTLNNHRESNITNH
jgi:hypothetical protein